MSAAETAKNKKSTPKTDEASSLAFTDSERAELIATVERLRAKRGVLAETVRAVYESLATDVQCSDRGKQTKGHGVARDGVAMAVTIDKVLDEQKGRVAEYSARRFSYLLERLAVLLRELDVVDAARKQVYEGRGAVTIAEVDAAAGREALRQKMLAFAGKREAELDELAAQQGTTRTRAELAASIASLAALARRWIARTGSDAVLAEDVGLVESVVQTAVKHRETLIGHGTESALDGSKTGHDTPLVNLAEGRVLVEMEAAMRAFDNEGPRNPSVPRLNPGPATRRALGRAASPSRGASDDGTKDSSKEPKTPPANNPATATTTRSTTVRKSTKTRSKR